MNKGLADPLMLREDIKDIVFTYMAKPGANITTPEGKQQLKREIGTAAANHILDPTAAALAAVFIDSATPMSQPAAQTTAAQDLFGGINPAGGVAAIPTDENMFGQNMAGGGIVAMAGGGDVQRFQNRGLVQTSPATTFMGNLAEYGIGEQPAVGMGSFYGRLNRDVQRGGIFSSSAIERDLLLRELGYTTQQINAMPREVQEKVIAENTRANAPMTREQVASDTGGVPAVPAPAASAPALAPAPVRRPSAPTPAAGISAIDEYRKAEEARIKAMEKQLGTEPTVQKIIESGRPFDKEYGVDRDFFKNQAAALIAQKEELKGDRKEAANMRLLEAGLAILGGTSPYAFENIGKGASKALAGFADDIKDIKKQTRELERARQDVLRAEQVAARSDSARDQDRFEKEKEKFRTKEAAIENARVDAKKTLVSLGLEERRTRATETQAQAALANAERPRDRERKPTSFKDIVDIAKSFTPPGKPWEAMEETERQKYIEQARIYDDLQSSGITFDRLRAIVNPTFQEALRRNLQGS